MGFYFERFEDRKPPQPIPYSPGRELLYQYLATISLVLGAWYLAWRWTSSLNHDALWFSIALVVAETCAYVGLVLFTINLWKTRDYPLRPPPCWISECVADLNTPHRPIAVDFFSQPKTKIRSWSA
jgi:cellulose synthase (UDP-forming)